MNSQYRARIEAEQTAARDEARKWPELPAAALALKLIDILELASDHAAGFDAKPGDDADEIRRSINIAIDNLTNDLDTLRTNRIEALLDGLEFDGTAGESDVGVDEADPDDAALEFADEVQKEAPTVEDALVAARKRGNWSPAE